jgi:AcrR family transcriptional regulator
VSAARHLLLAGGGEHAITIRRVADETGVSTPAVYLHFADKDELLDTLVDGLVRDLAELLDRQIADAQNPRDGLAHAGRAYLEFAIERRTEYLLASSRQILHVQRHHRPATLPVTDPKALLRLVDAVGYCQRQQTLTSTMPAAEHANFLVTVLHGSALAFIARPEPVLNVARSWELLLSDLGLV